MMDNLEQQIDELQNIFDSFQISNCLVRYVISDNEYTDLVESAFVLIDDIIKSDPMIYIQVNFHQTVYSEIYEILKLQTAEIYSYNISTILENSINDAFSLYYSYITPKRSYKTSFIRKCRNNVTNQYMTKKIEYLKNIPQPEQRTKEWYEFRYKFLTASNIWKAFISNSTKNQLIYDKCKPLNIDKYKSFSTESPMHWGNKYEPVSIMLYEMMYNTSVSDFGCIPHRNIPFLAASPDGINTAITSDRYGRMLEVKNIVNREITGIPKMEYWIQMQMQMEVCELNECDFLETRFVEYEDLESFECDGDYAKTLDNKQKGIIMYFIKDGQPLYEYAPINISESDFNIWEAEVMNKNSHLSWMKNIYWRLDQLSCVLVLRNKMWFKESLPIIEDLWEIIEKERISGYHHRSPKRNTKNKIANANGTTPMLNKATCFIDTSELLNILDTEIKQINITIETELLCTSMKSLCVIKKES